MTDFTSADQFSMTKPIMEMDLILDPPSDGTGSESGSDDVHLMPKSDMITVLFPIWIGKHPFPILLEVQVPRHVRPKRSKSLGHIEPQRRSKRSPKS
jgi:hypothetical protein